MAFKMKGSPMKRNFGIGSPMRKEMTSEEKENLGTQTNYKKDTAKQSFADAFKKARNAGKSEFTYKGKKYHTKTKEEVAKKTEVKKMEPRKITKVEPTTKTDKAEPKKTTVAKPLTRAEKRRKKNEEIRKKQAERTAKLKKFLKGFGPRSRRNK